MNTLSNTQSLYYELRKKEPDIQNAVSLIENGVEIHFESELGYTLLHLAALKPGTGPVVDALVERGAEVGRASRLQAFGFQEAELVPLDLAVLTHNFAVAQKLIGHGADIHRRTVEGDTLMHLVFLGTYSVGKREEMLRFLLDRGCDVNAMNGAGKTPLHLAVYRTGSLKEMEFLLRQGADPNLRDLQGKSPLHVAAFSESAFRLLIDFGADPMLRDNEGLSPVDRLGASIPPRFKAAVEKSLLAKAVDDLEGRSGNGSRAEGGADDADSAFGL